MQASEKSI